MITYIVHNNQLLVIFIYIYLLPRVYLAILKLYEKNINFEVTNFFIFGCLEIWSNFLMVFLFTVILFQPNGP